MEMKIRKATKPDWKEYYNLKKEEEIYYNKLLNRNLNVSQKEYFKEFIQKSSSKKAILLLGIENNKVVGFLHGTYFKNPYNSGGFIEELFITKDYRRKGCAKKLVEHFTKIVKNKGLELVQLSVNVKNKKAIKLYKKLKFELYHLDFRKYLKGGPHSKR